MRMLGKEFQRYWAGNDEPSLGERVRGAFKNKEPLKYRLIHAQYKLKTMISRLDTQIGRMQERDRVLFERVVEAQMSKDNQRAAVYANEVAELRKMSRQLLVTQIALEQVQLRLETIGEFADVFAGLGPVVGVINELKNSIRGMMPELSLELSELGEGLNDVVLSAGEFTGSGYGYGASSPEARQILSEATVIAEQRMKEKFPELPQASTITSRQ